MSNENTTLEQPATETPSPMTESLPVPVVTDALMPETALMPEVATNPGVAASECTSCGDGPNLVYALGQLDYDFGTEARRDSFLQHGISNPHDPAALLEHLTSNPSHATALTWTLVQDTTPIYAIMPFGAFGSDVYATLREFLDGQISGGVERVSIPGWSKGAVQLMNGQTVPLIVPELRGMYSWSTEALVAVVGGDSPEDDLLSDIANFLERIYYEIRNLGGTPQERAINYAATNAFQLESVFTAALQNGMKLDAIGVERSPICRPDSDCWDVKLTFFDPSRRLEQAREVFRFTIDVSDVVPVTVGAVRRWHEY